MIKTLSGIRFFLFVLILLTHAKWMIFITPLGMKYFKFLDNFGAFAGLLFFVLSGFCVALGYMDKFNTLNNKEIVKFYGKRLIRFYPLYLITGLICLIFAALPHDPVMLKYFLTLYVPMLSTWTTVPLTGGNEVGWFLQVLFVCYLLVPYILNFISKIKNVAWIYVMFFSVILLFYGSSAYIHFANLEKSTLEYLRHTPLVCIWYFILGLLCAILYKKHLSKYFENALPTLLESAIDVGVIVGTIYMVTHLQRHLVVHNTVFITVYPILLLYLCKCKSGIIYKLLTNKIVLSVSGVSLECYLIHYIIVNYCSSPFRCYMNTHLGILYYFTVMLLTTIFLSYLYKGFNEKLVKVLDEKLCKLLEK